MEMVDLQNDIVLKNRSRYSDFWGLVSKEQYPLLTACALSVSSSCLPHHPPAMKGVLSEVTKAFQPNETATSEDAAAQRLTVHTERDKLHSSRSLQRLTPAHHYRASPQSLTSEPHSTRLRQKEETGGETGRTKKHKKLDRKNAKTNKRK
ncbi:unnamed protein product [Boreogadus saida]